MNGFKRVASRLASGLDPALLLVWLLSVPAISPLIQPTLTRSADGLLHLYRLVALDHAIRQGVLFPRWLPDLAFGYGMPLFVFYAPLSYYLTEGLNLLGLGPVNALTASFALALLISGTGAYLFVKDLLGSQAGILAGVAYVYAPYQLYNTLERGSLPIAWAGAMFPLAFWAFGRLIKHQGGLALPLSALACGAALLSHNISNLIFLPLLIFYILVALWFRFDRRTLLRAGLAMLLGLGLAAFFLGPALLEKEYAQVERVITPPDFDYRSNFVTPGDLFSLPEPANTGLLNPDPPFTLGLAQVGLAVIGLVSVLMAALVQRAQSEPGGPQTRIISSRLIIAVFATLSLAGAIFMMLPVSRGVWDRFPLLAFVQQPHRLLSLTAFILALMAGLGPAILPRPVGFGLSLIGVILIFLTAVPLLYPRYYVPLPTPPTLTGMMAYEHASGAIGTTSFGEYLPLWVEQVPRESPLEPMYQAGTAIERLDPAYLAPDARIEAASYGFNRAELVIDSAEPFQAIFHTFYFPGWEARLDGQPQPVGPVSERGLVGLTIPAGRHQLDLNFRETPVRRAANVVSILALIGVVFLTVQAFRRPESRTGDQPNLSKLSLPGSQFATLVGLAVVLIGVKMLYLDHFDNALKRVFDGRSVAGVTISRPMNFADQVNLLGYDLEAEAAAPGQTFELVAYWQARQPLTINVSALAQLVDEQQHLYAGQDNLHPGSLPAIRWEPDGFVRDRHALRVPPGTPPGDYFLITGLYDPTSWGRLPVVDGGDSGWADVAAIPVTVLQPTHRPTLAELDIAWPVEAETTTGTSQLRLLGATPERAAILRSDFLRIALFWEAGDTPTTNYQVGLRLATANGQVSQEQAGQPSYGRYPTALWQPGERVRDNHALWIPPDFPAGQYTVETRLVAPSGEAVGDWIELGVLAVHE